MLIYGKYLKQRLPGGKSLTGVTTVKASLKTIWVNTGQPWAAGLAHWAPSGFTSSSSPRLGGQIPMAEETAPPSPVAAHSAPPHSCVPAPALAAPCSNCGSRKAGGPDNCGGMQS